ncbi:hypothetical protein I317_04172 [Kwoniella heveanensis CBS 569]|uniref:Uncharacterized protein n=1 Tax=Kwoniella heveanensis BCC8398 TaxID=1296120 RepID=A0A1B9GTI8_9TREE|nr:hypothetical protein I316_03821 [Kwoniella heveanensis BCC8398]OCF41980.1 hypothetical protein I317_04172 [Kwoniella heveanensis CBS 569]
MNRMYYLDTGVESLQVPAEQITEEAKKAEPDAVEEAKKLENAGESVLPTIT